MRSAGSLTHLWQTLLLLGFFVYGATSHAQETSKQIVALEQEIESLKEAVLKEKLRVRQLEEAVVSGRITSTYTYIVFKDNAQGTFELTEADFQLNGKSIRRLSRDEIKLNRTKAYMIMEGEVPPGENILTLKLTYRGQRKGPMTYLEEYVFTLDSEKKFAIDPGKTRAIEITVFDRGFLKSDIKDRLQIGYNLTSGS